jgi:pimeloyl-ACP methyl ester carboxylesterase
MSLDRRRLVLSTLAAGAGLAARPVLAAARGDPRPLAPQTRWGPPPPQAPAREGLLDINGVKLWHWDTGGPGEPIVLLHAFTGSAASWRYQQPVLKAAGYRVIAYSRRGHYRSEVGPRDRTGSASEDLLALADALKLGRFHFVGTAGGGFVGPDFALSHSERLYSMTLASTQGGCTEPSFRAAITRIQPPSFLALPAEVREVGPAYRIAYPEGVAQWMEQEHQSTEGRPRTTQTPVNDLTWANIGKIAVPTLMFTGDADLYMPPPQMRLYASHLPGCETAVLAEAGHSAYWEQPEAFNRLVLDFVRRHGGRR